MLDTHARRFVDPVVRRVGRALVRRGVRTNQVTLTAGLIGIGAAALLLLGRPVAAVIALWLSGTLDMLDGEMARQTRSTPLGTFLDIVLDRVVEGAVIIGLAILYPEARLWLVILTVGIVLAMTVFLTVGALVRVSSVKSFYYQPGLAERSEGIILLTAMILLPGYIVPLTVLFIAMEYFTTGQRFLEGYRLLGDATLIQGEEPDPDRQASCGASDRGVS